MKKYNKTKSNVNENIVDDQTRMIQKDEVKQKKSSLPPKNKKDKKKNISNTKTNCVAMFVCSQMVRLIL